MSFYNYLMNNEVEDLEEKLKLKEHKGFDFLLFPYCKEWGNAVEYSKFLEETAILSSLEGILYGTREGDLIYIYILRWNNQFYSMVCKVNGVEDTLSYVIDKSSSYLQALKSACYEVDNYMGRR